MFYQWLDDRCQHQAISSRLVKACLELDSRWRGILEARAKGDPRMKTEGGWLLASDVTSGVVANSLAHLDRTCNTRSFLFTLRYTATAWSEATAFCHSCNSDLLKGDRFDLLDNRDSTIRRVVPAIDEDTCSGAIYRFVRVLVDCRRVNVPGNRRNMSEYVVG